MISLDSDDDGETAPGGHRRPKLPDPQRHVDQCGFRYEVYIIYNSMIHDTYMIHFYAECVNVIHLQLRPDYPLPKTMEELSSEPHIENNMDHFSIG